MNESPSPTAATSPLREIVSTILPLYPPLDADQRLRIEGAVAAYVAGQIAAMPTFLRLPYRAALTAFDLACVARYGRSFRSLGSEQRESYVAAWNTAPVAPMRDFLKLIRSTSLLVYFDHPTVRERLRHCAPGEGRAGE